MAWVRAVTGAGTTLPRDRPLAGLPQQIGRDAARMPRAVARPDQRRGRQPRRGQGGAPGGVGNVRYRKSRRDMLGRSGYDLGGPAAGHGVILP
jgi:hypothetical protein